MNIENQLKEVFRLCLQDMQVELTDEFDRNFERKAFFAQPWQRRKGSHRSDKPLLMDTGALRRSISSHISGQSIVFTSTEPYAGIHNDGGEIVVTAKMRGYFWRKYKEAIGGFGYTKKGAKRADKANRELTTEAAFYRAMALKKVGSKIIIPCRRFIGFAPELETTIREIVERNLSEFFESDKFNLQITQE